MAASACQASRVPTTRPGRQASGVITRARSTAGTGLARSPTAGVKVFSPVKTMWLTITEPFGFVAASPTWQTVHKLPEGESITWTWGLWVQRDDPGPKTVATA